MDMDKKKLLQEISKSELGPQVCYKMKAVADSTIQEILTHSCSDLVDKEALAKYFDYFYWSIAYVVDHAISKIFDKFGENMEEKNND